MTIPGLPCRWDKFPGWAVTLWNEFVTVHKRGQLGLEHCPPVYLDCLEAELHAEAARTREASKKKETREYLKQQVW